MDGMLHVACTTAAVTAVTATAADAIGPAIGLGRGAA
jgi:hypothetical protein